jgi:hypothetical protein
MIKRRSAEEWRAELDETVRRYHLGLAIPEAREMLTHEEAVARIRKLGFTVGEALRLLRPKERS